MLVLAVMWVRGTAGSVPLRPPLLGAPELLALWALFASSESRSDIWCSWGGGAEQDDGQMLLPHPVAATGLVVSHCSGGRGMQGRAVPRGGGEGQEKKGPSSWAPGKPQAPVAALRVALVLISALCLQSWPQEEAYQLGHLHPSGWETAVSRLPWGQQLISS